MGSIEDYDKEKMSKEEVIMEGTRRGCNGCLMVMIIICLTALAITWLLTRGRA